MNKLDMESKDIVKENLEYIKERFPEAITEEKGELKIDPESLIQSLSSNIIDEKKEKYELTWPGKRQAIVEGNIRTTKTLRPLKEKSVNYDKTENIYIEGDNLEVLKILQESYLNKIKCIYIDPPYNTGNDFIYEDNFNRTSLEELIQSGQTDETGNRLITNSLSNGRFHSDWLSMMYPRLKLARNLLTDDGGIFISIDDNEYENLKKICNEIFGERNFVSTLIWRKIYGIKNDVKHFSICHDYILVYAKKIDQFSPNLLPRTKEANSRYKNPDNDPRGDWKAGDFTGAGTTNNPYEIISPSGKKFMPPEGKHWIASYENYLKLRDDNRLWFGADGNSVPSIKRFLSEVKDGLSQSTFLDYTEVGHSDEANRELKALLGGKYFDYPKPVRLLDRIIHLMTDDDSIILDFFSGSATTAHATMHMNSLNDGKRKYIMVQLPEECKTDSDAYKHGYKTICDLGEDRIKKAGEKIKAETNADIDYGFRVYTIDSSNMKDAYYMTPDKISQEQIKLFEDNIKEDRTPDDLITQVLLNLGLKLDLPIEEKNICGNKVFDVDDGELLACFDNNVSIDIIEEIARINPRQVVFRDSSFATDQDKVNFEERLKRLSAGTKFNVL